MTKVLELDGKLEIKGHIVTWDRQSSAGLAIEIDYSERLHIGGDPTEERIKLAVHAYLAGRNVGLGLGREQARADMRKVIGL